MYRLVLLILLLLPLTVAVADEPPAFDPGQAPPTLPAGKESYLQPVDRPDLIGYLAKMREQLAQFETPPPKTESVTALYDAWRKILKPRLPRMLRRIEKWEKPKRWEWARGERTPSTIKPEQWTTFTRDMASLATELHGAYKQYGSVKVVPKALPYNRLSYPGLGSSIGYPYAQPYGWILDRQAAGVRLGRRASHSYWNLMNRFSYSWNYNYLRRQAWHRYWRQRRQATEKLFEDLKAELSSTRDTLGQTLLGMQVFMAAMQNAEEERLLGQCHSCRTDDESLRKMGEAALDGMETARLEAERFQGKSSAAYGTLLRKWLRAHKAAVKVMEIAHDQGDIFEEAQPEEEPQGEVVEEKPADKPKPAPR